jgi:hemoglobin-like flavoprotein
MNNAKHQYEVVKDLLDHVDEKIMSSGSSRLSVVHFQILKETLLDKLADLLNDPVIAKAWDDQEKL